MDEDGRLFFAAVIGVVGYGAWWLWPLTAVVLIAVLGVVLLFHLRSYSLRTSRVAKCLLALLILSTAGLVVQLARHGRPVVWHLAGAVGAVVALEVARHLSRRRRHVHAVVAALRAPSLAATIGVTTIVAFQVVVYYRASTEPAEVAGWLQQLAHLRGCLADTVLIDAWMVAIVVVALLAISLVTAPTLRLVRAYRGLVRAVSLSVLALTVAGAYALVPVQRGRELVGAWRLGVRESASFASERDRLDDARIEAVKLLALQDQLCAMSAGDRDVFHRLAIEITESARLPFPDFKPPVAPLRFETARAPLVRRMDPDPSIVERLWERVASSLSVDEAQRRVEAIVRDVQEPPRDLPLDGFERLGVDLRRADVVRSEARAGALEIIRALVPSGTVAEMMLHTMMGRLTAPPGPIGEVDRRRIDRVIPDRREAPPSLWDVEHLPEREPVEIVRVLRGRIVDERRQAAEFERKYEAARTSDERAGRREREIREREIREVRRGRGGHR